MKIIVLVKEVPDTYGDRKLNLETGLTDRAGSEAVLDEISERSIEVALTYADANPGTEVLILSAGPASAESSLRKGLSMGVDGAIQVVDDALVGADISLTAETLAAAIRDAGYDLVIAGNLSTDGSSGMVPAAIAEHLDVAHLSFLQDVAIGEAFVSGSRSIGTGTQKLKAELPAVISVTERLPDARFPNFKGIMAAKKKPLTVKTLADLGVNADDFSIARSIMLTVAEKPPRSAGLKIIDEGDAAAQLASFLVENRLV
jgi:electron transfer flavoprotein beta subunit